MSFKTGHAVRTDARRVYRTARQVKPVARVHGDLLIRFRQDPRNAARNNIQHFVKGMRMRAVFVKRFVRPHITLQILAAQNVAQLAFGRWLRALPARDSE